MIDLEARLRDGGRRWRDSQPDPAPFDPSQLRARGKSLPLCGVVGLVALSVAAAVTVLALVVSRGENPVRVNVGGGGPGAGVPIARPPLLDRLPRTTPPLSLASGQAGGTRWVLYAKVSPLGSKTSLVPVAGSPALSFDPGLCFDVAAGLGNGGGCGDPRQMAALVWQTYGPTVGFDTELVYGVTSVPAASVVVSFGNGQPATTVKTFTSPQVASLRFYVTRAPAGAIGAKIQVEAFSASGAPLLRSDPYLPPPPPDVTNTENPGTYPLWPLDPTDTAARNNPTAVARDFSTTVLGVTGNTITADPTALANGPTKVTIALPAGHGTLQVVAYPQPDGTWALLDVGNQADKEGITFAPGGPTMAVRPPIGATQADITERAADGVHRLHLSQTELRTGAVQLIGNSIHDVLFVWRNATGVVIGAIGDQF